MRSVLIRRRSLNCTQHNRHWATYLNLLMRANVVKRICCTISISGIKNFRQNKWEKWGKILILIQGKLVHLSCNAVIPKLQRFKTHLSQLID